MKKRTAYLGLTLLFLAGVGVGITGHSAWIKGRVSRFKQSGPSLLRDHNMQRMTEKLALTDEQRVQIEKTMLKSHEQWVTLRKTYRKEISTQKRETIQSIESMLTKDQRTNFRSLLKEDAELLKQTRDQRKTNPTTEKPSEPQIPTDDDTSADSVPAPTASDAAQNGADAGTS